VVESRPNRIIFATLFAIIVAVAGFALYKLMVALNAVR